MAGIVSNNSSCHSLCSVSRNKTAVPEPYISEAVQQFTSFLIGGCLPLFVSVCGVSTNVINCVVFHRQGLRDRMNLCLFSLSLIDLLYLASYIVLCFVTFTSSLQVLGVTEEHYQRVSTYSIGIMYAFRTTSGLYIMVIAIERCVCVAFPLRTAHLMKTKTMGIILVAIGVVSQLGFVGQPLKYDVIKTGRTPSNQWESVPSKVYLANKYLIDTVVYTVFSISIPLITFSILSIATLLTVIQLATAMAWRRKVSAPSTEHNSQQIALTKTLVVASCVYILSMIPNLSMRIARLCVAELSTTGLYYNLYTFCNAFANFVALITSSANFFIYYTRSSRYRNEFKNTFYVCENLKR